ncbi:DNA processing single strand binding protein, partial [Oceanibaculum indicum P24]
MTRSALPSPPTAEQRLDWLRLIRTENVGPVTFRQLVARFGDPTTALAALPELARQGGRTKPLAVANRAAAEREVAALQKLGARLLTLAAPD